MEELTVSTMPPSVKEQDVSPELQEAMYTYMGKHNATSDARLHDVTYLTQLVYIPYLNLYTISRAMHVRHDEYSS